MRTLQLRNLYLRWLIREDVDFSLKPNCIQRFGKSDLGLQGVLDGYGSTVTGLDLRSLGNYFFGFNNP
jgi:hypothetical protein